MRVPGEQDRERKQRARQWKKFRKDHLMTQIMLADLLGISRRTVQMVEAGRTTPYVGVLSRFRTLQLKYSRNR